ncbi:MAG: indolepyruvate oxidoreductase [Nitrospirae bacterium]|nr:indolepyruvate oxidoreductase [Nitrospirota bacterium]
MKDNNIKLMSGNEAIGRGAIEAGISIAVSYPGTPSTDILEYLARNFEGPAQWVLNEKIALETAIGVSYTGKRAICSMKHVGVNVAADPLMTAAYLGIKGGLVLVVADDPGAYSSQNEQDTRFFASFAKLPCLEPSDAQEAKDLMLAAFELSEKMELPVILRTVTRVSHALSPVSVGEVRNQNALSLEKNPAKMLAVPSNVVRCHKALNKKQEELKVWARTSGLNKTAKNGQKKCIISCGIAFTYAKEFGKDYALLKIAAYPFDEKLIEDFVTGMDEVWVVEEGYPVIENIARKFSQNVKGKITGELSPEGELGPDALAKHLASGSKQNPAPASSDLPIRPPVMCPGCPHREFYKALKEAGPSFTAGDIGCYTLGAAPPLSAMDTCLCMGASISKAAGISSQGVKRVAAVLGDSTFLHSGIPALISAVYNNANILVVIMDNDSTAMTGHQPTPLTGITAKGEQGGKVSLEEICRACGVKSVEVVNSYEIAKNTELLKQKLESEGVNVVISRSPCVLLVGKKKK